MNTELTPDGLTAMFDNKAGFVLWFKPTTRRGGWEPVHQADTERECVHAVGCGGRHGGKWIVLPHGNQP